MEAQGISVPSKLIWLCWNQLGQLSTGLQRGELFAQKFHFPLRRLPLAAQLADGGTDRANGCRAMTDQFSPIDAPVVSIGLLPHTDAGILHLGEERIRAGHLVSPPVARDLLLQFDAPIVFGMMLGTKADELLLGNLLISDMAAVQAHNRPTVRFSVSAFLPPQLALARAASFSIRMDILTLPPCGLFARPFGLAQLACIVRIAVLGLRVEFDFDHRCSLSLICTGRALELEAASLISCSPLLEELDASTCKSGELSSMRPVQPKTNMAFHSARMVVVSARGR